MLGSPSLDSNLDAVSDVVSTSAKFASPILVQHCNRDLAGRLSPITSTAIRWHLIMQLESMTRKGSQVQVLHGPPSPLRFASDSYAFAAAARTTEIIERQRLHVPLPYPGATKPDRSAAPLWSLLECLRRQRLKLRRAIRKWSLLRRRSHLRPPGRGERVNHRLVSRFCLTPSRDCLPCGVEKFREQRSSE